MPGVTKPIAVVLTITAQTVEGPYTCDDLTSSSGEVVDVSASFRATG